MTKRALVGYCQFHWYWPENYHCSAPKNRTPTQHLCLIFQKANTLSKALSVTVKLFDCSLFQTGFQFYFFTSKWSGKFHYRRSLIMNIRFPQACKIRFLVAHIDWIIR